MSPSTVDEITYYLEKIQDSKMQLLPRSYGLHSPGASVAIASIIGPILAGLLVFNRVYWRIALVHTVGLDDLCILLSLFFLFVYCSANIIAVDAGYGRPSASLVPHDLHRVLQMFYLSQIFYKLSINLTKLSILALYLRIFSEPWFRRLCLITCTFVTAYTFVSTTATVFQCTPIAHTWNKSMPGRGRCINLTAFWYTNATYNLITDGIILLSVPWVVWSLSLTLRQRVGLIMVFGLGVFVFATSILRFTTLDVASKTSDPSAGTARSALWTTIEACTAVGCACLPMLRTLLQRVFPHLFPNRREESDEDPESIPLEQVEAHSERKDQVLLTSFASTPATTMKRQHTHQQKESRSKTTKPKAGNSTRHLNVQAVKTTTQTTTQDHVPPPLSLALDQPEKRVYQKHQPTTSSTGGSTLHAT